MMSLTPCVVTSIVVARSRRNVSASLADQLTPVLELYAEIRASWPLTIDEAGVRARVRSGLPAVDVMAVLRGAGDLTLPFRQALTACERAGLATSREVFTLCRGEWNANALIVAWASAEAPPSGASSVARRAAAIVGGAILRRTADLVAPWIAERRTFSNDCPTCGAAPDLGIVRGSERSVVCARCDTEWRVAIHGCLGCAASSAPELVRVRSPFLGYSLLVCNSCGRYLKERTGSEEYFPIVERELTLQLDAAALERGLRL